MNYFTAAAQLCTTCSFCPPALSACAKCPYVNNKMQGVYICKSDIFVNLVMIKSLEPTVWFYEAVLLRIVQVHCET